jgi:hypothetical protein
MPRKGRNPHLTVTQLIRQNILKRIPLPFEPSELDKDLSIVIKRNEIEADEWLTGKKIERPKRLVEGD